MKLKNVENIITPGAVHFVGDGFRVHTLIPGPGLSMQRMSPFIMMDYNPKHYFPPSDVPRGVGVHPHRGFETVTIAYKGRVAHHDSAGGGGVIGEGDVQWMTAASGILHKEYHETEWSRQGGEFQMVQLWVNLPAKYKMTPPKYQAITAKDIQHCELEGGHVEVIAGNYRGVEGAASTFTPVHLYTLRLKSGASAEFDFPEHYTTCCLVLEGGIRINNHDNVPANHLALFANAGEHFSVTAQEDSVVLLLSGEPINEPIAHYGPFVMNTQHELVQAVHDFNNGTFGYLEE